MDQLRDALSRSGLTESTKSQAKKHERAVRANLATAARRKEKPYRPVRLTKDDKVVVRRRKV